MKSYAIANVEEGYEESSFLERIGSLSRLKVDVIQLRAKQLDDRDLLELATRCRNRVEPPVIYLINGRADVAVAVEADGVHLPSDGVPVHVVRAISSGLKVGISCHTVEEVQRAAELRADLAVLGPLFETRSSTKSPAVSVQDLRDAAGEDIDVYALGGLTVERLAVLEGTGVTGVAAVTMFMHDDPIEQIVSSVSEARS